MNVATLMSGPNAGVGIALGEIDPAIRSNNGDGGPDLGDVTTTLSYKRLLAIAAGAFAGFGFTHNGMAQSNELSLDTQKVHALSALTYGSPPVTLPKSFKHCANPEGLHGGRAPVEITLSDSGPDLGIKQEPVIVSDPWYFSRFYGCTGTETALVYKVEAGAASGIDDITVGVQAVNNLSRTTISPNAQVIYGDSTVADINCEPVGLDNVNCGLGSLAAGESVELKVAITGGRPSANQEFKAEVSSSASPETDLSNNVDTTKIDIYPQRIDHAHRATIRSGKPKKVSKYCRVAPVTFRAASDPVGSKYPRYVLFGNTVGIHAEGLRRYRGEKADRTYRFGQVTSVGKTLGVYICRSDILKAKKTKKLPELTAYIYSQNFGTVTQDFRYSPKRGKFVAVEL